ncbi:MAG: AAA family ATPase [Deinococcales bacterium]
MDRLGEEAVFGRWQRRQRRALDLTQKALAGRVGCSTAPVRKLESDERRPSRRVALGLASALRVPDDQWEAFVRFARNGWADRPPGGSRPDLDRPWLSLLGEQPVVAAAEPQPPNSMASRPRTGDRGTHAVGRQRELERLDGLLERALEGAGGVVLVRGDAGQGKSTLLWSFAQRAQAAHPELLVAAGTCNAFTGAGDPFQPFREVLGELTGDAPLGDPFDAFERERIGRLQRSLAHGSRALLDTAPALVGTLLPGAALLTRWSRAGLPSPPAWVVARATQSAVHEGLAGAGHAALRAAITAFIAAVARDAPLLLLLDDLQWVDESSADALLHLARSVAGERVLVVGAFRPSDIVDENGTSQHVMRKVLHEIERVHEEAVVDLEAADHRAFLEGWLDSEPNRLGRDFREALWRLTGGQPLFTVELLRAMQERGELVEDVDGRWVPAREVDWSVLPDRVAGVLGERVARLDPEARAVLRVASVEGEIFTAEAVARTLERTPRSVTRVIGQELHRRRQLVVPVDVRPGAAGLVSRYRFRHNLIQRYVYDQLDEAERGYLHEAVGTALEELLGEEADPVALADHFLRARAPGRAAPYLRRAGDHARQRGAVEQAVELYGAALEHGAGAEPSDRAALLRDLGECRFLRGELKASVDDLERARAILEAEGDVRQAGAVLATTGFVLYEDHAEARGLQACNDAVARLEGGPETAELAMALSMRAQLTMMMDENERSLADGERALAMAERLPAGDRAEDGRVRALASVAAVLSKGPERRHEGLAMLEEGYRTADRLGMGNFAVACEAERPSCGLRRTPGTTAWPCTRVGSPPSCGAWTGCKGRGPRPSRRSPGCGPWRADARCCIGSSPRSPWSSRRRRWTSGVPRPRPARSTSTGRRSRPSTKK